MEGFLIVNKKFFISFGFVSAEKTLFRAYMVIVGKIEDL